MYKLTRRRLNTTKVETIEIYSDYFLSQALADLKEEQELKNCAIGCIASPIINNTFQSSELNSHFEYKVEYYNPVTDSIFEALRPANQFNLN